MKLEVIAQNVQDVTRINLTSADRIELAVNMEFGGYTPYKHIIDGACENSKLPIVVMVRRHHDNYMINEEQMIEVLEDIEMIKKTGAQGIVWGAITEDNEIDEKSLKVIMKAAGDLDVVFHRAFDLVEDKFAGIEILKKHKVKRVLTTGGTSPVLENIEIIKELVATGFDVMIGGGVTFENANEILKTGVEWLHIGSVARQLPTESDLDIGETQLIPIRRTDKRKKQEYKTVEPKPFNPWDKLIDMDRTTEFKVIKKGK